MVRIKIRRLQLNSTCLSSDFAEENMTIRKRVSENFLMMIVYPVGLTVPEKNRPYGFRMPYGCLLSRIVLEFSGYGSARQQYLNEECGIIHAGSRRRTSPDSEKKDSKYRGYRLLFQPEKSITTGSRWCNLL